MDSESYAHLVKGWVEVEREREPVQGNFWKDELEELNAIVELNDECLHKASEFGEAYARSANRSFRSYRSNYGTKGEMAVHAILSGTHSGLSEPDLNIYPIGQKRHGYDLSASVECGFHVKTCDFQRWGKPELWSFVFEKDDHQCLFRYHPNDFCYFCIALDERHVLVRWRVSNAFLAEHALFKPLRSKSLSSKVAVYDSDLSELAERYGVSRSSA